MRRRNPPTHDAAAQVRFSSTGLTRTTSWSEKIMSVVGLLVIKPMSQMGQTGPDDPETGLPKDARSRHLQGQSACIKHVKNGSRGPSFDHLVGVREERHRHIKAAGSIFT